MAKRVLNTGSFATETTKLITSEDENGGGLELTEKPDTAGRTYKNQNDRGQELTELPDTPSRTFEDLSVHGQEAHCMVCRKSKTIRNVNDLRPGDHIEMPMFCLEKKLKLPIKHHAIVKEIRQRSEQEGATHPGKNGSQNECHTAQVMVIDVSSAGKTCSKTCCGLFKPGPFKVASHALYGENEINCKKTTIKRVDYHRRRNSHEQTLKNAEHCVSMDLTRKRYNVCVRNSEHFCVAMVNQDHQRGELDNIERATSLQSARCFWLSFHIILSMLQFIFYVFNFYLYAVYAEGNERYNHYFGNTSSSSVRWCYTGSNVRGFTTRCDWITFAILLAVYIFAYVCLLCIQCRKRKDVCNQCIISARIVFITKLITFCAIEMSNIFGEKYLYAIIDFLNMPAEFTWFVIFFLSLFELLLLFFWVPHVVVKCMVKRRLRCCECHPACCNPCCFVCCCYPWNFDEDSYEYVIHYA